MWLFLFIIIGVFCSSNAKTCDHPFEETPGGKCLFNPMGVLQVTWDEGQRICRWMNENGHLVEFQSYDELQDVTSYLKEHYGSCSHWSSGGPWIGAVEVADTNEYIWQSTNSTVAVANWIQGQPNNPTSGDAAMMHCEFSFQWMDRERDNVLPILCEMPPRWKCPSKFTPVGGTCYYIGKSLLPWDAAQEFCHALAPNGKLAELETVEEIYAVTEFLMKNGNNRHYWIGAEERATTEPVPEYEWATSGKPVFVTNWYRGYSPDSRTDDVIHLAHNVRYRWNDSPRTDSAYELCEADPADLS